jgi:hypothetical protein
MGHWSQFEQHEWILGRYSLSYADCPILRMLGSPLHWNVPWVGCAVQIGSWISCSSGFFFVSLPVALWSDHFAVLPIARIRGSPSQPQDDHDRPALCYTKWKIGPRTASALICSPQFIGPDSSRDQVRLFFNARFMKSERRRSTLRINGPIYFISHDIMLY